MRRLLKVKEREFARPILAVEGALGAVGTHLQVLNRRRQTFSSGSEEMEEKE